MKNILVLIVLCVCGSVMWGQLANQPSILGVVKDQSGAVVGDATVTITNVATNVSQSVKTDAEGRFDVLGLQVGTYSVTASRQGFADWKLDRLVLQIGQHSRLAPVLGVAAVSQRVVVAGLPQQMQTQSATVETVIQQKQIVDLPLNGRNAIQLVGLVPGMQYTGQAGGQFGAERNSYVQGSGIQSTQVQFSLDGFNSNGSMDEGATNIPSVDTIAEFSVQTSNFSAENGRYPLQVVVDSKAGSNEYHGSLWEFNRSNAGSAINYFATKHPKLVQNQFGAAVGGRIIRNKTFFFGSYEGLRVRHDQIFNNSVPTAAMRKGDFSALSKPIIDPQTGLPFPNNQIPASRIDSASSFFLPYIQQANAPDGNYRAVAPTSNDTNSITARIDDVITPKQHIFGRWVRFGSPQKFYGYSPQMWETNKTIQNSWGVNYTYAITQNTVFSVSTGYQKSNNTFISPQTGKTNLTEQSGIQGFSSAGRETGIGLPTAGISGYAGFAHLWGVNGHLWSQSWNGTTSLTLIKGKHQIDLGMQYQNDSVYGNHSSFAASGSFSFNGQYTGNGFADYLLGLTSSAGRNFVIAPFGVQHSPYAAFFVDDTYRISKDVTLNLGLRYDRWYAKQLVKGAGATFDPKLGKVIAGTSNGKVDLSAQPEAPFLAAATAGLWIPSTEAHIPAGLFEPNGYLSPRVGFAWRVGGRTGTVLRAAYGIFTNSFQGNLAASSIVGPPYWDYEEPTFAANSMQNWQTAFPGTPNTFSLPGVSAPAWNATSQKVHEWNASLEQALPLQSALTLSYVGNHLFDGISGKSYNDVPAGFYPDLQAARPFPELSEIAIYQNTGETWYNALQAKWERRFVNGFTFTGAYAYSKLMMNNMQSALSACNCAIQPFTPKGYLRGRSSSDVTNLLTANAVYQLPFGHGRQFGSQINRWVNEAAGGWELSGILSYASGSPLTFDVPGATLGNGYDTRPNLVGSLNIPNKGPQRWFNTAALAAPAPYTYGDSGMSPMNGPQSVEIDTALLKDFPFTESAHLQLRFEAYNLLNHPNFGDPNTSIGESTTGEIFTAGAPRELQFGLKMIF